MTNAFAKSRLEKKTLIRSDATVYERQADAIKHDYKRPFFQDFFRSLDYYGTPVQLYYQGRSDYRTAFGSTVSVLSYLVFLALTISCIVRYSQDWNPVFTEYRKLINIGDAAHCLDPFSARNGFRFAFGIMGPGTTSSEQIPEKYGNFTVEYVQMQKDWAKPIRTPLAYRQCSDTDFTLSSGDLAHLQGDSTILDGKQTYLKYL